jgi:hypothetical protein
MAASDLIQIIERPRHSLTMNRETGRPIMLARSLLLSAVVLVAGCQPAGVIEQAAEPLPLGVPINAVMVALVDFSADGVWRPAASETPLADEQWLLAEQDAINLIASTTLMTTPGTGTNDAAWVKDTDWRRWATEMRTVALEAKAAVDTKDQPRLALVGDRLVELCQACHQKFKPGLPVMGITRFPIYPKHDGTLTPP